MNSRLNAYQDIYSESFEAVTFGLSVDKVKDKFNFRHVLLIICAVLIAGNSMFYVFLAVHYGSSISVIISKSVIPTGFLFFAIEWCCILSNLKYLSSANFNVHDSKSALFVLSNYNFHEMLISRNETYLKLFKFFTTVHLGVLLLFISAPPVLALQDWFSGDRVKLRAIIPMTDVPHDLIVGIILYVAQAVVAYISFLSVMGNFHWATSFTYMVTSQVMIMEMALIPQDSRNLSIPLKDFIEEHASLLEKVRKYFWCFQIMATAKIIMCTIIGTFYFYLMAKPDALESDAVLKCAGAAVAFLSEFIIFCYLGTVIKTSLNRISDIVYHCNWLEMDSENIRSAIVVMAISQNSKGPIAWGATIKIELSSVIDVLRLCYSVFNLFLFFK